jgi:hypothetical protein
LVTDAKVKEETRHSSTAIAHSRAVMAVLMVEQVQFQGLMNEQMNTAWILVQHSAANPPQILCTQICAIICNCKIEKGKKTEYRRSLPNWQREVPINKKYLAVL